MMNFSTYEQPLNERIRLLMRFESMFNQMRLFARAEDYYEIQLFLEALFDVLDFLHRYEIRSELIKELQRYKATLSRNLDIQTVARDAIQENIEKHLDAVHQVNFNLISVLRENELLNSLRQRNFLQSGNCLFEIPAYQYWLEHRDTQGNTFLSDCYERFISIEQSIALILQLVRTGNQQTQITCQNAIYIHNLDNNKINQMIRIHLPKCLNVFPRISGDRHRFALRFMRQDDPTERAYQINDDIEFGLQICTI